MVSFANRHVSRRLDNFRLIKKSCYFGEDCFNLKQSFFIMQIEESKIVSRLSKEQNVNFSEAEKAISSFFSLVRKEIESGDFNTIEIKHLGKFIPKKPSPYGNRISNNS